MKLYGAVDGLLAPLLLESVERRDTAALTRLLGVLRARYEALGKQPTLARGDVDRLLDFAVEVGDGASLAYIVPVLMRDRPARSLGAGARANLAAATRLLKAQAAPDR